MKALALIISLVATGTVAFAQSQNQVHADVSGIVAPSQQPGPVGQAQVHSNVNGILAGSTNQTSNPTFDSIVPGHYVIATECGAKCPENMTGDLFIERSSNNDDQYVAILLSPDHIAADGRYGYFHTMGRLFHGEVRRNSTELLLTPYERDQDGSIVDVGRLDPSAPVLRISKKPTQRPGISDLKYPYLVTSVHGDKTALFGMRGANTRVALMPYETNYMFTAFSEGGGEIALASNQLTVAASTLGDGTYSLDKFNGDSSAIFTMSNTKYNVISDEDNSATAISGLAVFLKQRDCRSDVCSVLVVGTPVGNSPTWLMNVYAPQKYPNVFERFFGHMFHTLGNYAPTSGLFN